MLGGELVVLDLLLGCLTKEDRGFFCFLGLHMDELGCEFLVPLPGIRAGLVLLALARVYLLRDGEVQIPWMPEPGTGYPSPGRHQVHQRIQHSCQLDALGLVRTWCAISVVLAIVDRFHEVGNFHLAFDKKVQKIEVVRLVELHGHLLAYCHIPCCFGDLLLVGSLFSSER